MTMMPIDYGVPMTAEEKSVVIGGLVALIREGRCSIETPDFLRQIKWPQRRLPDLRGFLMKHGGEVSESLRAAAGRVVGRHFFVTRSSLWFVLPGPGECEECGKDKLRGHEDHCLAPFSEHERRAVEIVRSLSGEITPRERALLVRVLVFTLAPESGMKFVQACQWAW